LKRHCTWYSETLDIIKLGTGELCIYLHESSLEVPNELAKLGPTVTKCWLKLDYSSFCACAGFVYIFCFGLDPLQLYNMKYNGYALNKFNINEGARSEVNFFFNCLLKDKQLNILTDHQWKIYCWSIRHFSFVCFVMKNPEEADTAKPKVRVHNSLYVFWI
jgi:hypothetical protein